MYFNEQVITDALNIETSSRGYAITGNEAMLEPFTSAENEAKTHFEILRRLTQNDERRKRDLDKLEKQLATKQNLAEEIVALRKTKGQEAAAAFINEGKSKLAMDEIRASVDRIQKEEMALMEDRQASHLSWLGWFNIAMFLSVMLTICLIVLAAFIISNNFKKRKAAEIELAASKQLLQSIIDNTSILVFVRDINGRFLMLNKKCAEVMGGTIAAIVDRRDVDLLPEDYVKQYHDTDAKVIATEKPVEAEELALVDGKERTFLSVKFPLFDENGKIYAIGGMSTDITDRKKSEEKILELNTALEANVFRLNNINRELEAFTYSVSHDLRAPLRAINGFASLLLSRNKERMDEECSRITQIIKENSQQMGQLIDDLLAFSRIGRYKPKLQEIDMRELADMVLQQLTHEYPQHKIALDVKSLEPITCDPALIKQVWVNLISNALKYSSHREAQHIEIGSRKNNMEIVYYVKDNGAGFDMRYYDKLFGIFQRLHSNNDFEGTGVGLAIVHRIVKRHSGRVWAESKIDEGATFYFSLPKVAQVMDV